MHYVDIPFKFIGKARQQVKRQQNMTDTTETTTFEPYAIPFLHRIQLDILSFERWTTLTLSTISYKTVVYDGTVSYMTCTLYTPNVVPFLNYYSTVTQILYVP